MKRHLLISAALLSGVASAAPLRLCLPEISIPPFTSSDPAKPGLAERLLRDSARQAGIEFELRRLPPQRCRKALEDGEVDVAPMAAVASNLRLAVLPMRGGQTDVERRFIRFTLIAVRRSGDLQRQWDGQRFTPERPVIGVRRGLQIYQERLTPMGLKADDAANSGEQLLDKLAIGRIDFALLSRGEFDLLQASRLRPLEALAKPFAVVDYYLALSPRGTPEQRRQIEGWWAALARLRELPTYNLPASGPASAR